MKTIVVIIAGSLISFLALLLIGLAVLKTKPELFGIAPESAKPAKSVASDTMAQGTPAVVKQDNPQPQAPVVPQAKHTSDTLLVARLQEHADSLEQQVDSLKQSLKTSKQEAKPVEPRDWTSTAKLLASMNADDAGKILKQMSDSDLRQILNKMQKRQAGKILAVLDPGRVARILR